MDNKYEARIFPNGRVVLYEAKDLEDAIEAGKELLIICNCNTGGNALALGGNKVPNWDYPSETITFLYSRVINYQVFTGEEMSRFHKVIFTSGRMVFGDDFNPATQYSYENHCFYNGNKKMVINERLTAKHLNEEGVKAMIEIGVLTKKALKYCVDAESNEKPDEDSVDCCSGY